MERGRGGKEPKGAFGKIGFYKMTPIDRTAATVTKAGQRRVFRNQKRRMNKRDNSASSS
jgi:hypothetical protein